MRLQASVTSDLEGVRNVWKDLQSNERSFVFQTVGWVEHWLNTAGSRQKIEPRILSLREEKHRGSSFIAPLEIRSLWGVRLLTILGGFHADYAGAVFREDWALSGKNLWDLISEIARKDRVDGIWIRNIPSEIGGCSNPLYSPEECRLSGEAPFITLTGSWEDFLGQVKTRIRADSRRQRKRLSEMGSLSFRVAKSEEEATCLTEIMIDQKKTRYAELGIRDQFREKANVDFFMRALSERPGLLPHVSGLFLDDKVLAVHWGEVFNERFYYLMPSHDMLWEKYSPGRLLLEHLIEWSLLNRLRIFDFTVGGEAYKQDWANGNMPLYELSRPLTLKGALFLKGARIFRDHVQESLQAIRRKRFQWKA